MNEEKLNLLFDILDEVGIKSKNLSDTFKNGVGITYFNNIYQNIWQLIVFESGVPYHDHHLVYQALNEYQFNEIDRKTMIDDFKHYRELHS